MSYTRRRRCGRTVKPFHTSNIVEPTFDNVEATFDFVARKGNNVERVYRNISSFRQSRNKLNMFSLFQFCRKDEISFDIVAETGNIVVKNGNSVEATFDIVERIVQLVAFDNFAWTLLLVWTGMEPTYYKFAAESAGERILKISQHLAKLQQM